jgi:hypothetical protein
MSKYILTSKNLLIRKFKKAIRLFAVASLILFSYSSKICAQVVSVNSTQLTGGLAGSPLFAGSSNQAILGFTLDKAAGAGNTVTSITVPFTQDPSVRFSSAALYTSSDATYDGTDISVATGTIGASTITFTGAPLTNFSGAGAAPASQNFFVVVTVSASVTVATTATTPSLTGATNVVSSTGTPAGSVTGNAYSFTTPPPNSTSTISLNGGTTTAIDYISFQASIGLTFPTSVSLAQFQINDLGGDVFGTTLIDITLSIGNFANVRRMAIFDGTTKVGEKNVSSGSVTFNGLSLTAANSSTKNFTVSATFNSVVTDKQQIDIAITSATSSASGSGFATANAGGASTSGTNDIQVTRDRLVFSPATTINTVPAPLPSSNFAPLSVKAVDFLGNLDLDATNTVTLTSSGGTFTKTPSGTPSLTLGVLNYTNLTLKPTGTYTLTAQYGLPGVTDATITVNVASPGVDVVAGSLPITAPSLCLNGDYQVISDITLTEQDPADFAAGSAKSFFLLLPTGFEFKTSVTTAPTISGPEISGITSLSYTGTTIVKFSYTISGTTNPTLDKIVIKGLEVKYTGTVFPFSGNLTRFGGTAVQVGNADIDAQNHATLNAAVSGTVVDFNVATIPGQTTVNASDTRFYVGINSVQLVGSPAGGTFSGPGVSPNATYGYVFSPSSVGVSTGNAIVYTYMETTGQHCQVFKTKSFDVYASTIQNLQTSYCTNSGVLPSISVLQSDIDAQFGAGTHTFYDFIYISSFTGFFISNYNYLGTNTAIGSSSCFFGCSYSWNTIQGSVTVFDPSFLGYLTAQSNTFGRLFIYYRVKRISDNFIELGSSQPILLNLPPQPTFNLPKTSFCATDPSITLTGVPAPVNPGTDKFSGAGTSSPSTNNWIFTPATAIGASTIPVSINIIYSFTDGNACNASFQRTVIVNPIPPALLVSDISGTGSAVDGTSNTCVANVTAGTFSIKSPALLTNYSWYKGAVFKNGGITYTPVSPDINLNAPNPFTFFVTQTKFGCESLTTPVVMNVQSGPTLNLNAGTSICFGASVDITQSTTGASIAGGANTAIWSTTGDGTFAPSTTIVSALTYNPGPIDKGNGKDASKVDLVLTTDVSSPACPAASKVYQVVINPIPDFPKFTTPSLPTGVTTVEYCDDKIAFNSNFVAAGEGKGTISFYKTSLAIILQGNIPDKPSSPANYSYAFNPNTERTVDFLITQTVNGCTSLPATLKVLLHPVPVPAFSISNFCFDKNIPQAPTQFTDQTPSLTSLGSGPSAPYTFSYQWDFGDFRTVPEQIQMSPTHPYLNIGTYNTRLTVTTNKGCSASSTFIPQEIGPVPQTDFAFDQLCLGNNTKFKYDAGSQFDNTTPGRRIDATPTGFKGWVWDFAEPSSGVNNTSNLTSPTHQYAKEGLFNVTLKLTSELGCNNSKTKQVYVLPKIKFDGGNSFSYSESFEDNKNGINNGAWATEALLPDPNNSSSISSWGLSTPNGAKIGTASNGVKAWVAGLQGTNKTYNLTTISSQPKNETSALNGPCLDLSGLQKPIISFDYIVDTYARNDGAYVQYSTDNGITWKTFGNLRKGVNWYNNSFISGLSSTSDPNVGQAVGQEGWDGDGTGPTVTNTPGWNTGRYSLSGYGNNIRIRFLFGSGRNIDPTNSAHNGFGIDNVIIENSNRTVLAENFINNAAVNSGTVSTNFISFKSSAVPLSLLKIQYHTSFGGADAINALNSADPQARAAFYGVTSSFKGFIDAYSNGQLSTGPTNNPTWGDERFDERALTPSPLTIDITPPFIPSSADSTTFVKIKATIKIGGGNLPIGSGRYLIQMAIVEDVSGEPVLRKLLPNAAGKLLTAVTANATQSISYIWQSSAPINPSKLSAICFVQDLLTKEVLQASSATMPTTTIVTGIEPLTENDITIFPNPANQEFTLQLPKIATQKVAIKLIDQLGKEIDTYSIGLGEKEQTISTRDLAAAIYILQIETAQGTVRKKVMVAH